MSKISKSKRNYLYSPYQVNDSLAEVTGDTTFIDPVLSGLPANLSRNLWDDWNEETMLQDDTTLANFASGMDMTFAEQQKPTSSQTYNFLDALIMENTPKNEPMNGNGLIPPPLQLNNANGGNDMASNNYTGYNQTMEYAKPAWQPQEPPATLPTQPMWPPQEKPQQNQISPPQLQQPPLQQLQQPQLQQLQQPQLQQPQLQQSQVQPQQNLQVLGGPTPQILHSGMNPFGGQNVMMPGFVYSQPMMGFNPMMQMSMPMQMNMMQMNPMMPMPQPGTPLMPMAMPPNVAAVAPNFIAKPPLKPTAPFVQIARKPGTPEMSAMLANLLEEEAEKKNKKLERNRDSARESRRKQQKYVEVLEDGIQQLQITKEHIQRHRWGRVPLNFEAICGTAPRHGNAFDIVKWTSRQKRMLSLPTKTRIQELNRCFVALGHTLSRLQASILEMQIVSKALEVSNELVTYLGLDQEQAKVLQATAKAMQEEETMRIMILVKAYKGLRRYAYELCSLGPTMDVYFRETMSNEQMCKLLSWSESSRWDIERLRFDTNDKKTI
ncbi:hypothetical protein THRCLA_04670 [Thraustotheca clavata]|uniref:BZIP domain-containing protein n=1 Tax=Thraustotheca clavata TaxID=74557 RepID=A0A1V9ZYC3_9STRA|nr:hypothetical protein THRCLA_04670 [Thraustotheca clavata]